MQFSTVALGLVALSGFSFAFPSARTNAVTTAQILLIANTSSTCSGATYADECATADVAAKNINTGFTKYGVETCGEKAALISLMAYETAEFKYNKNHYPAPGRPGQGTRNMQMAKFNLLYASSISELTTSVKSITNGETNSSSLTDDQLNQVRALVLDHPYDFSSAAWYLTTQCDQSIRNGLAAKTVDGWTAYITDCVGTTVDTSRQEYWEKALKAI
ncbi:MAG: hypothetical protein M1834_004921 [Cirrosporium novae-zelandiae]|nr:MAG: hypothetical protein M1834_004921 [Cirrosporium novae-zelandiae]